jgi:hypothetical protein
VYNASRSLPKPTPQLARSISHGGLSESLPTLSLESIKEEFSQKGLKASSSCAMPSVASHTPSPSPRIVPSHSFESNSSSDFEPEKDLKKLATSFSSYHRDDDDDAGEGSIPDNEIPTPQAGNMYVKNFSSSDTGSSKKSSKSPNIPPPNLTASAVSSRSSSGNNVGGGGGASAPVPMSATIEEPQSPSFADDDNEGAVKGEKVWMRRESTESTERDSQ